MKQGSQQKHNHPGTPSAPKLQLLQWSEHNWKPSTLPPLKTTRGHKNKTKTLTSSEPVVQSQVTIETTDPLKNLRAPRKREQQVSHGKMQAKIRLMRLMLRNQRASLQELYSHEGFLSKLNQDLIKAIEDMEDSTAMNVRTMLQQQGILGNVIDILEYSNRKRVQQLRSELQEWEEEEESKINNLHRQVEQLNAEVQKAQEEVSFLSTYMDHEYPVKSVQIANSIRQVQQAKDRQQDELDNLNEMRQVVLESLSNTIQEKKKKILSSLMAKTQKPYEETLLLKTRNSQRLRQCMVWFRELIEQLRKEIPVLMAEVEQLNVQICDPREVVFEDILLQRPKCTPDMAVELNVPVQEPLLF